MSYSTRWNSISGGTSSGMCSSAYDALGSPSRGCPTLPGVDEPTRVFESGHIGVLCLNDVPVPGGSPTEDRWDVRVPMDTTDGVEVA